jgi:hypothetical protein
MALMDLNGDSGDENEDDGTMEREKQSLEQLERALSQCQLCGPGKYCKIGKTGEHVSLTTNQRRAWSVALVFIIPAHLRCEYIFIIYFQANKTYLVTLTTPPKSDIFHMFFSSLSGSVSTTSTPATPTPGMAPAGMMSPYNFMLPPWMMPQPMMPPHTFGYSPTNSFYPPPRSPLSGHRSRHRDEMPSSDPPDSHREIDENPYPGITEFLRRLDEKHVQRGLSRHFNTFEGKDFYNIDELANISVERLSAIEFGLSAGNAQFFLDAIHKEMKQIDRARKGKSRRQ